MIRWRGDRGRVTSESCVRTDRLPRSVAFQNKTQQAHHGKTNIARMSRISRNTFSRLTNSKLTLSGARRRPHNVSPRPLEHPQIVGYTHPSCLKAGKVGGDCTNPHKRVHVAALVSSPATGQGTAPLADMQCVCRWNSKSHRFNLSGQRSMR